MAEVLRHYDAMHTCIRPAKLPNGESISCRRRAWSSPGMLGLPPVCLDHYPALLTTVIRRDVWAYLNELGLVSEKRKHQPPPVEPLNLQLMQDILLVK